jgi:16S rRNA (guanine966-N2)-methyltransferase
MRIISGKYRGRQLHPPKNLPVRPTTDFARESLFNVLNNMIDFEGLKVLDLFAGTGSISVEFLSRGAATVIAVDADFRCHQFIRRTAETLGDGNLKAVKANVFPFLERAMGQFDIVFADPPYEMERVEELPDRVIQHKLLAAEGWFILEHSRFFDFSGNPFFRQHRKYGNVNFSFFQYSSS